MLIKLICTIYALKISDSSASNLGCYEPRGTSSDDPDPRPPRQRADRWFSRSVLPHARIVSTTTVDDQHQ